MSFKNKIEKGALSCTSVPGRAHCPLTTRVKVETNPPCGQPLPANFTPSSGCKGTVNKSSYEQLLDDTNPFHACKPEQPGVKQVVPLSLLLPVILLGGLAGFHGDEANPREGVDGDLELAADGPPGVQAVGYERKRRAHLEHGGLR